MLTTLTPGDLVPSNRRTPPDHLDILKEEDPNDSFYSEHGYTEELTLHSKGGQSSDYVMTSGHKEDPRRRRRASGKSVEYPTKRQRRVGVVHSSSEPKNLQSK